MPTDDTVRRGAATDADAVAALLRRAREQNVDSIPAGIHPKSSMQAWVRDIVMTQCDVWVAEESGAEPSFSGS